jgi:hypothetical protein
MRAGSESVDAVRGSAGIMVVSAGGRVPAGGGGEGDGSSHATTASRPAITAVSPASTTPMPAKLDEATFGRNCTHTSVSATAKRRARALGERRGRAERQNGGLGRGRALGRAPRQAPGGPGWMRTKRHPRNRNWHQQLRGPEFVGAAYTRALSRLNVRPAAARPSARPRPPYFRFACPRRSPSALARRSAVAPALGARPRPLPAVLPLRPLARR